MSAACAFRRAMLCATAAQLPMFGAVESDATDYTVSHDGGHGQGNTTTECGVSARYDWETDWPLLGHMCAGQVAALCAAVFILAFFLGTYTYCRIFGWSTGQYEKVGDDHRQPATARHPLAPVRSLS